MAKKTPTGQRSRPRPGPRPRPPCTVCRHLRRRCSTACVMAPYFPAGPVGEARYERFVSHCIGQQVDRIASMNPEERRVFAEQTMADVFVGKSQSKVNKKSPNVIFLEDCEVVFTKLIRRFRVTGTRRSRHVVSAKHLSEAISRALRAGNNSSSTCRKMVNGHFF